MVKKGLNLRISERRLDKLRYYANQEDKTMTRLIEDWIDSLVIKKSDISEDNKCYSDLL